MAGLERTVIGMLGGLTAVIVKVFGQNQNLIEEIAKQSLRNEEVVGIILGYMVIAVIPMFLGGLICWASGETNRMKLLALGVSAPALITTWTGSGSAGEPEKVLQPIAIFDFMMTPAFAQTSEVMDKDEGSFSAGFKKGISTFLGTQKEPKYYWVVVGSSQEREKAQETADSINRESKDLSAFVGIKNKQTGWWPVIVGYGTYREALEIKNKALQLESVTEVYLSPN